MTHHPDKTAECFPCSCISCPGYHECDLDFHAVIGDEHHCDICDKTWRCVDPGDRWKEDMSPEVAAKVTPPRIMWESIRA